MASNVTRDHHSLRRNLKLNGNHISNDGQNEGISMTDDGRVGIGVTAPYGRLEVNTGGDTLPWNSVKPALYAENLDTTASPAQGNGLLVRAGADSADSYIISALDVGGNEDFRVSGDGAVAIASLTASEIVITDSSKNLSSAAVATYPSLTELAYVKGVTSAIQTQLDATLDTAGALIDLSSTTINVDLTEASAQTVVAGDYILFLDGGTTGSHAKGSIHDVATLFAGTGMTATSSVMNVIGGTGITANTNDIALTNGLIADGSNITSVGTLTGLVIDKDDTSTSEATTIGLDIDYDHTGSTSSNQTMVGLNVNALSNTTTGGTHYLTGVKVYADLRAASTGAGIESTYGLHVQAVGSQNGAADIATAGYFKVSGTDANTGIFINCEDGGDDLKIISSAGNSDHFTIRVIEDGETKLTTHENSGGSTAHLTLDADGDITLKAAGGDIVFNDGTSDIFKFDVAAPSFYIYDDADTPPENWFNINVGNNGNTTMSTNDNGTNNADFILDINGYIEISSEAGEDITLAAGSGVIHFQDFEDTDDAFKITVVGGTGATTLETVSDAADGHLSIVADGHVEFDGCGVGFDKLSYTDATNVTVDFRQGNKAELDLADGSISGTLSLKFPDTSGNFLLVVKQDGSTRTIAAFATLDAAGNAGDNDGGTGGAIRWAGGSAPDLTDGSNKDDILTFYWDADLEVCYGVATLNF